MKRMINLLTALFVCTMLFPVAAESSNAGKESPAVVDDDTTTQLKESGKQALNDMKGAFKKATEALDKQMKSISSKACVGKWKFENGKCITTIECLEDSTMELVEIHGHTRQLWKGTYTSTATAIQLNILIKESKTLFTKSSDAVDDYWTITYKVSGDKEMKLSSPELPHDDNGYDFANPTLFVKE